MNIATSVTSSYVLLIELYSNSNSLYNIAQYVLEPQTVTNASVSGAGCSTSSSIMMCWKGANWVSTNGVIAKFM